MHAWSDGQPLRLLERPADKNDPEPKALCCYGLLLPESEQIWLRFVDGRPISGITCAFLEWVCQRLALAGKQALLLVWDNASWHISHEVRKWIRSHNRQAKREGGVRIVAHCLPVKSPWLNPIEPRWVHGKRAIVEPARKLTAVELIHRVCDYFGCEHVDHLTQLVL
jgi:transposase